jgi:chorismate dehydratase
MTEMTAPAPIESAAPTIVEASKTRQNVTSRKVGVVPFLNAQPLIWGLAQSHRLSQVAPNAMAQALKDGTLDIALAPVVAGFLNPELEIIPSGAIGAKGPVKSVRILTNGSAQETRRLFVDDRSQTSVLLSRLILKKWFGVKEFEVKPVDMKTFHPGQTKPWESVLQFGDNALVAAPSGMGVIDLAEEWHRFTGKPFVFAVWMARDKAIAHEMKDQLDEAKAEGLKHLEEITAQYQGIWQFKRADAKAYLEKNIDYTYDAEQKEGQALFQKLLKEEGLIP